MLLGISSSAAPFGRGTNRSCNSSLPTLYGARLTTPVLALLLFTLDAKLASSAAHSLNVATSTRYGRPKHRVSCSLSDTYARAKLPSSATNGLSRSHAVGLALACACLCCSAAAAWASRWARSSSSRCRASISLRFFGEAKTRLKVEPLGFAALGWADMGMALRGTAVGFSSLTLRVSWNSRSLGTTSSNSCPMGALRASSSQAVVTQWTPLSRVRENQVRSSVHVSILVS